jgi:hypothetical protein
MVFHFMRELGQPGVEFLCLTLSMKHFSDFYISRVGIGGLANGSSPGSILSIPRSERSSDLGMAAYDLPIYRMAAFFIARITAASGCPRSSRG